VPPARPYTGQPNPQQPVRLPKEETTLRALLKNGDLMAKGNDLRLLSSTGPKILRRWRKSGPWRRMRVWPSEVRDNCRGAITDRTDRAGPEARLESLLDQASKKEPSYADFLDELVVDLDSFYKIRPVRACQYRIPPRWIGMALFAVR
jgi:hypothetical protein